MKKILALSLSLVLLVGLTLTTTIAYLTDEDRDTNVMTLGKISIEQIEEERKGQDDENQDELVEFEQNKPIIPAVYPGTSIPDAPEDEWVVPGDQAWKVVADQKNVLDKFVTVKNDGNNDAYVRTVFAIEVGPNDPDFELIHFVSNGTNIPEGNPTWNWNFLTDAEGKYEIVEIDGGYYIIAVATYTAKLAADEVTIPSLKQIYLDKTATAEDVAAYGDDYQILVVSQAAQADGFEDYESVEAIMNEAFYEVTATNHPWTADNLPDDGDADDDTNNGTNG